MEDTYRSSMLKTFKKTLDDGFFPFIILDTINDRVKHFDQFWSAAKTKGFEVSCVQKCVKIKAKKFSIPCSTEDLFVLFQGVPG